MLNNPDHAEAMISGSLTNNTGTIMLVTGSGRVGILTETPQEALDVGDNSDVSARIGRDSYCLMMAQPQITPSSPTEIMLIRPTSPFSSELMVQLS